MVKTDLTPSEKISAVSYLRKSMGKGETLAYVGDGFHDADMFDNADIGIALNAMGDEQAEDAADVILMDDDIMRVPAIMRIVSDVSRLIQENLVLLGASKLLLLILALSGLLSLLPAALLHTLCCCLACLNSLRSFTID
jgi:Cd2+/Zn2+-exporting ATPase